MAAIGSRNCIRWIHTEYLYSAPSRNLLRGALSPAIRSKIIVLRNLQKEDTLFWGSKRSVRGSSFQGEEPVTEKTLCCLSAERARGTKSSPRAEERRARLDLKPAYRDNRPQLTRVHTPEAPVEVDMPWVSPLELSHSEGPHCNWSNYPDSEVDNNKRLLHKSSWTSHERATFLSCRWLVQSIASIVYRQALKSDSANRNIRKKDIYEQISGSHKYLGPQRFHQSVWWGLSRSTNQLPWNLLNYKNFESNRSVKHSCLECFPNN